MKVAIYFVPGFEEVEALSVVDVLRRGNVEVIMVGVEGLSVTGAHHITVQMDTTIQELVHDEIGMMILPGGPGTHRLGESKELVSNLKAFKAEHKWLAAICAAPSILGQVGLLKGEKATCYPGYEDQLLDAEFVNEKVVVSGKIVTAMGAGAALDFGFTLLEIIKDKETATITRKRMIAE